MGERISGLLYQSVAKEEKIKSQKDKREKKKKKKKKELTKLDIPLLLSSLKIRLGTPNTASSVELCRRILSCRLQTEPLYRCN